MNRNQISVFVTVQLCILILPMVFPYLLGAIVLPVWVYLMYAVVVFVNAGFFLINSSLLIDNLLIKGKFTQFVLVNIVVLAVGFGIQFFSVITFEKFIEIEGATLDEILSFETRLAQIAIGVILGILSVAASLAFTFSNEWKVAQLRYNDAIDANSHLKDSVVELESQVSTLVRENESIRQNSNKTAFISVKVDLMMRNIRMDDICYLESEGDYIHIHTVDGKSYMTLMTMKNMEKMLPFDSFCRVHRSFIVNVDRVAALRNRKLLVLDRQIPLADSCRAAFFEILSHKMVVIKSEKQ